jgi:hypothetical protein
MPWHVNMMKAYAMCAKKLLNLDSTAYQRWYKRNPQLECSVRLLMLFTSPYNEVLFKAFKIMREVDIQIRIKQAGSQSLGEDKVLGLFKSKKKRRDYDQDPLTHRIMNEYWLLSEEHQNKMAILILQSVHLVFLYIKQFTAVQENPSLEDIARLSRQMLEERSMLNDSFFQDLESFLYHSIIEPGRKIKPVLVQSKLPTFETNQLHGDMLIIGNSGTR